MVSWKGEKRLYRTTHVRQSMALGTDQGVGINGTEEDMTAVVGKQARWVARTRLRRVLLPLLDFDVFCRGYPASLK